MTDIEGEEEAAFAGLDLTQYTVRIITVERPTAAMTSRLRASNFTFAFSHGNFGDQMWLHRSIPGGVPRALAGRRASSGRQSPPGWVPPRAAAPRH